MRRAVSFDAVSCLIEMHAVSARTGDQRMRENMSVAALSELKKRTIVGRMTIGIDLGDKKSHFCILNEQAQVIARGFLPSTISAFRREFEGLPPCLLAIEAGAHSLWANQVLKVCGHDVLVGNPRKIRLITESDRKSDRVDAESLARLARADRVLLAPIQHRTQEKQVQLAVIRARHVIVRSRTALINCARGLVKPMGLRFRACSADAFAKRAAATPLPDVLRIALAPLLKQIEAVNESIRDYDRQIEQIAATEYPETYLLKQIKGVGTLISLTYVLTLEDPHRFAKSRDVGAFLGFLPREKQSGERAPRLGISRAGNEYLRTLLVQGAHYILGPLGPDTDLRRWGLQLASRGGGGAKKRAVTAVARKLAVLLHHCWKTGEVYEPLRKNRVSDVAAA
jgi:transposase